MIWGIFGGSGPSSPLSMQDCQFMLTICVTAHILFSSMHTVIHVDSSIKFLIIMKGWILNGF